MKTSNKTIKIKEEDSGTSVVIYDDSRNECSTVSALSDTTMTATTTSDDSTREGNQYLQNNHIIKSPNKLNVSFGDIEICSYEVILGDNPGVSGGPPLTIEWNPFQKSEYSVDEYERCKRKNATRNVDEMKMTSERRMNLLSAKHSLREILQRTIQVANARRQREETQLKLQKSSSEEKVERIKRALKNIFTNKKRKEKRYMEIALQGHRK